ncbi:MAG: hypothetical protein HYZ65_07185 [Burkholderiales bacterium]|nr:hypothetical protein [Burkholderiales bacterium]
MSIVLSSSVHESPQDGNEMTLRRRPSDSTADATGGQFSGMERSGGG